jgi:hypothetical protein
MDTSLSTLSAYVSIDEGKTWILINTDSALTAAKGIYDWTIPPQIEGPSGNVVLSGKYIDIRIMGYGDADACDETRNPVLVSDFASITNKNGHLPMLHPIQPESKFNLRGQMIIENVYSKQNKAKGLLIDGVRYGKILYLTK